MSDCSRIPAPFVSPWLLQVPSWADLTGAEKGQTSAGPRGSRYLSLLWGRLFQAVPVRLCLPSLQHPLWKKSLHLGPPSEHTFQCLPLTLRVLPARPLGLPLCRPTPQEISSLILTISHPHGLSPLPTLHHRGLSGFPASICVGLCFRALLTPSRDVVSLSPTIPLGWPDLWCTALPETPPGSMRRAGVSRISLGQLSLCIPWSLQHEPPTPTCSTHSGLGSL